MKKFSFTMNSYRTVQAALGRGLSDIPALFPRLFSAADKLCLVTGAGVPRSLVQRAGRLFPPGKKPYLHYVLPFSEKAKSLDEAGRLCAFLFRNGFSRDSLIVAAGGGAVTDLAGFAASIYMRGLDWVSVPTTFLGQIDAGLGGKTAVNLGGAKNIAGTFHLPALTVCDTAFMDSLPPAELRAGAGELVKYAMIGPASLSRTIEKYLSKALKGNRTALTECVTACAAYKLRLAARDLRDESGVREILNFGHTAGHAFEALSKGRLSHGDAVARGSRFALIASRETGLLKEADLIKMNAMLDLLELPPPPVPRGFAGFAELVSRDKKARGAVNRFVLLRGRGRPVAVENLDEAIMRKAYEGALR